MLFPSCVLGVSTVSATGSGSLNAILRSLAERIASSAAASRICLGDSFWAMGSRQHTPARCIDLTCSELQIVRFESLYGFGYGRFSIGYITGMSCMPYRGPADLDSEPVARDATCLLRSAPVRLKPMGFPTCGVGTSISKAGPSVSILPIPIMPNLHWVFLVLISS